MQEVIENFSQLQQEYSEDAEYYMAIGFDALSDKFKKVAISCQKAIESLKDAATQLKEYQASLSEKDSTEEEKAAAANG